MKPLNRPMFRYGGPIKEGVMSGIREPKKNGGLSKQFNTGLVGDERYPKTEGREHHFAFLAPAAMAAARFLPAAYRGFKAARAYKPMSETLGVGGRLKNIFMPRGGISVPMAPRGAGAGFRVGSFLRQNPITTASLLPQAAAGTYAVGSGAVKAVPGIAKSYIDALIPGESIFREKDGSPKTDASGVSNINKTKRAIGMPENLTYRASTDASKKGGGVELSAEERRAKNVERYRDIMDIKGMNKDAAYKSLISASQLINESGDFKGDIKSGKLINKIIQATSKQFDKPKQTKDAIDTLILKGEIEKDINASDPKSIADLAYKQAATQKLNKELKGNSTAEIIQARMLKDDMPSGSNLASLISINNPELNIKTLPTKDLGNADPIDYMTQIVATVNADETTPDYPAGVYVLKDKVIQITEEGSVIPVPINALK
ncbi:hypothetical protein OAR20_00290 [Candidatus Pelagibacter sp.]|nr:hypothetical protein [Candidatus Pelagibacter sp.]